MMDDEESDQLSVTRVLLMSSQVMNDLPLYAVIGRGGYYFVQQNIEQSELLSGMEKGWDLTDWWIRLPCVKISDSINM